MLSLKEFREEFYLTEELHEKIKSILNEPERDSRNPYNKFTENKFNRVSKLVRELSEKGENTGLENGKPKKGSSRAWLEHNEDKHIILDGKPTTHKTGIKIAIHGTLDKHTGHDKLLGELQNQQESDHYFNNQYSMLHHNHSNDYSTNHDGVLAPVLDHHDDHHWLEMSKTDKLTKSKFKDLTKNDTHPKGLDFDHFSQALLNDYHAAHGMHSGKDEHDHIREHPYYESMQNYMHDSGMHPGDIRLQNMGVWTHPITKKEYPVIRDHGYSTEISKLYSKGWKNKYKR